MRRSELVTRFFALATSYEHLPSACQPGAFVVLEWFLARYSDVLGSREFGLSPPLWLAVPAWSYALTCNSTS